jgi:predicted extracellular nuclease/2',3'-cyclic-nucleotide 2'-phosphodiesterase (5'-nucleotidase family)
VGSAAIADIVAPAVDQGAIEGVGALFPYLSANLDFSGDGALSDLVADALLTSDAFSATPDALLAGATPPKIAPSTIIEIPQDGGGVERVGVVGATTQILETISSPSGTVDSTGGVEDMAALAAILQPEIDALVAAGVNKIVTLSHLQNIALEQELAGLLSGVDIMVAGGSDTRLADGDDVLRPGDEAEGGYPFETVNADGAPVLIVSTDGEYSYVGRLVVDFDDAGVLIPGSVDAAESGAYATIDSVVADVADGADLFAAGTRGAQATALAESVTGVIAEKDGEVFGISEVYLEGARGAVRTEETNLGDLTADANLAAARAVDDTVLVSLKNGGGVRAEIGVIVDNGDGTFTAAPPPGNDTIGKPEGGVSQLDLENALRFNNRLALVTLSAEDLKIILEHGVAASAEGATPGRFPQVGGIQFSFDPARQAQELDGEGGVVTPGERIRSAVILGEDGRPAIPLVEDGAVVADAPEAIRVVTLDFLAGGGDGYPYPALGEDIVFVTEDGGVTADGDADDLLGEQQALAEYLAANFGTDATAFDAIETPAGVDARIQNLAERGDSLGGPIATDALVAERLVSFQGETGDPEDLEGGSEVVAHMDGRLYTTNGASDRIDIWDIATEASAGSIDLSGIAGYAGVQSVAAMGGLIAAAVDIAPGAGGAPSNGVVALYDADSLEELATVEVGALPDMLTFTPDGATLLVANEGEPANGIDVPGGVSIIDVAGGTVHTVGFEEFDSIAPLLKAAGVRIFPTEEDAAGNRGLKAPSLDLEPEYIAVTPDGETALVSLQEANAVAVLDIAAGEFTDILPLGVIDHLRPGFEMDTSDRDNAINIAPRPVLGMHMPDAIAVYEVDGRSYLVTANEGDARNEDERVKDDSVVLDPTAFPDADALKQDEVLGRYQISTIDGDIDGDGDLDLLFGYGSRSFSIFDENGNKVFDSGAQFERIIAELRPELFNSEGGDTEEFDGRSDNKGPEPEGVAIGRIDGEIYAFIGLERDGGIMVYNVSDPANAHFVQYVNAQIGGDVSPETLAFVSAADSPSGVPLLLVANEVSGTTSVFQIEAQPRLREIAEVQGAGHRSPLEGQAVKVQGVVTAIDPGEGFFVQSVTEDGDAATSEGLFIDERNTDALAVGLLVEVTGTVTERQFGNDLPTTTLDDVTGVTVLGDGQPMPGAVVIGPNGILPPTGAIDDDGLASFDPAMDGIDFFESLEGMRIMLESGAEVIGSNAFGEIFVTVDPSSVPRTDNGGLRLEGANGAIADANPERIILDDDIYADFGLATPGQVPQVVTGDTLDAVTGVLDYSFGEFKLLPSEAPTVTPGGTVRETTKLTAEAFGDLTVATYNVLNLDPSDGAQFDTLGADIVANMGAPHIIGLQEIQDNNGPTDDGTVAADMTYQALIDAIIAAGGPAYAFADSTPADKADGGQPGANIRVGFLYDPAEVSLLGTRRIEGALDPNGAFDADPMPGDGVNEGYEGTRKPLAATFEFRGEEVTVIVNHFKSKSGDDPLSGAVQPPVEVTREQRIAQAQVVNLYVDGLLAADPDANVVVLGDFNDFEFSDPLAALAGDDLVNLMDNLPGGDRYSFIFNGNSQVLDHVLVSDALAASAEIDAVHINADFPVARRGSDHDPIVARFDLNDAPQDIALAIAAMPTEGDAAGTVLGTLDGTDPDTGDLLTFSLLDDAGGMLALDGSDLVLADVPDFETMPVLSFTVQANDLDGAAYSKGFALAVADMVEQITGGDSGGALAGGDGGDRLLAGAGNDTLLPGGGSDTILLGAGGADEIAGTGSELDGDVVGGFGADDAFVFLGERLAAGDISYDDDTGALTLGGASVQLLGQDLGDGAFMVTREGEGDTARSVVQFVAAAADRGEKVALAEQDVNGIAASGFLTGQNGSAFSVTLGDGGAGFDNTLGYFTRDLATGEIEQVGLLFESAKSAGSGATAAIAGVEADDELGFFLVQNGAARVAGLSGDLGLAVRDGRLHLTEEDMVLADTIVFNSLEAGLNADGLEHVVSGASADGTALEIGFEDLLGRGDMDFQDVTFSVTVTDSGLDMPLV